MVVEGLTLRRYWVLEIGRWRKQARCPGCGNWFTPTGGYGNTPGTPDLAISHNRWPPGCWLLVELKKEHDSRVRPSQRPLIEAERAVLAWTWEQVWAAVKAMEARWA